MQGAFCAFCCLKRVAELYRKIDTFSKSDPMTLVFIVKIERTVRGKLFDLEQTLESTQVARVDVMCLRLEPSLCCP